MGTSQVFQRIAISIHALLAESDDVMGKGLAEKVISIHALLAESDAKRFRLCSHIIDFYPRSPCGERQIQLEFNSLESKHFYPRSPCGERRVEGDSFFYYADISIHALLAESDNIIYLTFAHRAVKFLSTLSLRRATAASVKTYHWIHISIHALLAESDGGKC